MRSTARNIFLLLTMIFLSASVSLAQPYIDIINVHDVISPDMGFFQHNKKTTELNYFNLSSKLPFQFKNKKDALVISPFFEEWSSQIRSADSFQKYHYGMALPVSLLKSIQNSNWRVIITLIIRMNGIAISTNNKWQFGGALLAENRIHNGRLTYKIGVYINQDLFGLYVVPLLGIDWRINDKTNLFGLLPGNLTLEHKLSSHFYCGATFRAITNSYADTGQHYFRIDENELGMFADFYLTKHAMVNLEAGHSLFRQIDTGIKNETTTDWGANDNAYLKLALAYRIRLR